MNISPKTQQIFKSIDTNKDGNLNVAEIKSIAGDDMQLSETEAAKHGIDQKERNEINKAMAQLGKTEHNPSEIVFKDISAMTPPHQPGHTPPTQVPTKPTTPDKKPESPSQPNEKQPEPHDSIKHPQQPTTPPKPVTPGGIQDGLEKLKKNPVAQAKEYIDGAIGNRKDPAKLTAEVIKFTRSVEKMSDAQLLEVSKYLNEIMRGSDGDIDELMGQFNELVLNRMQENNQSKTKDELLKMLE